jgi:hypothetical protein
LVSKILDELGLDGDEVNAAPTPIVDCDTRSSDDTQPFDKSSYATVVGELLYLTHSRPDITYAVSILSGHSHAPTYYDWKAAKRVGRYLVGTRDLGIIFRKGDGGLWLHGYADASFASHEDARSHTVLLLGIALHSAPIFVTSKKQTLVALSSTESELEALKTLTTAIEWLSLFMEELGYSQPSTPVDLFEDNLAAIHLSKSDGNWGRTRHFAVRYQYIKSKLEDHTISIHHVPTDMQIADIFTKSLPACIFTTLRDYLLGIEESPFVNDFMAKVTN